MKLIDILKDKDSSGQLKWSLARILLIVTFTIYLIACMTILLKSLTNWVSADIDFLKLVMNRLEWMFAVLLPYVFGQKALEFIKEMVNRGDKA